ncbi:MAG: hypothetical protein WCF65_03815 [Parachlamydiaceae bacterium]
MTSFVIVLFGAVLADERDWSGIYGGIFHYSMIFATSGSALLAFFYFWKKGRLDLDEEPKILMMQDDRKEDADGA